MVVVVVVIVTAVVVVLVIVIVVVVVVVIDLFKSVTWKVDLQTSFEGETTQTPDIRLLLLQYYQRRFKV